MPLHREPGFDSGRVIFTPLRLRSQSFDGAHNLLPHDPFRGGGVPGDYRVQDPAVIEKTVRRPWPDDAYHDR
jgi:hypothetical protein